MPAYKYTATDAFGSQVKGSYEAFSEQEVKIYLQRNNLEPIKISRSWLKADITIGKAVKDRDLIVFTRMFGAMIRTATPIDQALKILYEQTSNPALKKAIQRLIIDVESGENLSESMRNQPAIFDDLFVNLIAAGETSGNLDVLLGRLADLMERSAKIKGKVKSAMVYPIVLSVVSVGSVVLLLTFVIPQFLELFEGSGVALPLPTQIVIGASNFLQAYWMWLLGALVAFFFIMKRALKNPQISKLKDRILLNMKVIGPVIQKGGIARFTRTMSTLIHSGVSLVDSLALTSTTTGNIILTETIQDAQTAVSTGAELHPTFRQSKHFPPLVSGMMSIGEQSGELDTMLETLADFYEDDVERTVESALKLIEPIMLLVMGAVIGLIMASIYLPMFDMIANIGG